MAREKNTKAYGSIAVLVFFLLLCCCDKKYFGGNHLMEKGFVLAHSSRIQFVLGVGRLRRWELEAAGHRCLQSEDSDTQCTCLPHTVHTSSAYRAHVSHTVHVSSHLGEHKIILGVYVQRPISWVILDSAKLTINSDHQETQFDKCYTLHIL